MILQLPDDLERSLHAVVTSGRFASATGVVAQIVREYLPSTLGSATARCWRRESERRPGIKKADLGDHRGSECAIPSEVWDALPADLSEQHDHYIYGTPKHPASRGRFSRIPSNWIAISNPRVQWHAEAMRASRSLRGVGIVTTQEVLGEFLTALRYTPKLRSIAIRRVSQIYASSVVLAQSVHSFHAGPTL